MTVRTISEADTLPLQASTIAPDVERVYAIGDVHGRADLLASLLDFIETEAQDQQTAVVFLGDLVDRGPESRAVLDLVVETIERFPDSVLCLGNHDEWYLRFLQNDPLMRWDLDTWLSQGGAETLQSYDFGQECIGHIRDTILQDHPRHLALLRGAVLLATWRDFAFVHAGIDPSVAIEDQTAEACLWIRAPFLRHVGIMERIIVHGHSPQKPARPHVTENRISLDTGAFFSHVLTAAVLDAGAGTLRFIAAHPAGLVRPIEPVRVDRGSGTLLSDVISGNDGVQTFSLPKQKGAALRPPSLAGVSGHEKPDTS